MAWLRRPARKLGDLAVLSDDYFTCPEADSPKVRSALTVVGGRVVHQAETAKE